MRGVAVVLVLVAHVARAQAPMSGAIRGRIVDAAGEPIAGVRVVADHAAVRTDRDGVYSLDGLAAGEVLLACQLPGDGLVTQLVRVAPLGVTVVDLRGGRPRVHPIAPSVALRLDLDRDALWNLPLADMPSAFALAPGAHADALGLAFGDATSRDNRSVIAGVDTTALRLGGGGTVVPVELLDSIAVITGGMPASSGPALGAYTLAVTPTGTNAVHGSVFASLTPAWLRASRRGEPRAIETIDATAERAYDTTFGFTLGGPIVRDHAWFHVGVAPQRGRTEITRTVNSRVDCHTVTAGVLSACESRFRDGNVDVDPVTGFELVDEVDRQVVTAPSHSVPVVASVVGAVAGQRVALAAVVVPSSREAPDVRGAPDRGVRTTAGSRDLGADWTGRVDRLQLGAQLAWHRATVQDHALRSADDDAPQVSRRIPGFEALTATESDAAIRACTDLAGSPDRFPLIRNCPLAEYVAGGPGRLRDDVEDRRAVRLASTYRAGGHAVEVGAELVRERTETAHVFSGGAAITQQGDPFFETVFQFANLAELGDPDPRFDHACVTFTGETLACQIVGGPGSPGSRVDAESHARAAYVRDVWHPSRDVVIDAGVRFESQDLLYPDDLRGRIDPLTHERVGDVAIALRGNIAPRLGIAFDPTGEARGKLYASGGRVFEPMTTEIVEDQFSRSAAYVAFVDEPTVDATRMRIDPRIAAGYVDEVVTGAELEVAPELVVGAGFQHRALGRAVEDVSLDDGESYVLANPGRGLARDVDRAVRRYDAVTLRLQHTTARAWLSLAYTESRTRGNYPGTVDEDGAFGTAHASPQLDVDDAIVNRDGVLGSDRPHALEVDGYRVLPVGRGALVLGGRLAARSGTPISARGLTTSYETLVVPRGRFGRLPLARTVDVHVAYRHRLRAGLAELYVDVFDVLDHQAVTAVDERYTLGGFEQPISGGDATDLLWLKQRDFFSNLDRPTPVQRNRSFLSPIARAAPATATIGARVTF